MPMAQGRKPTHVAMTVAVVPGNPSITMLDSMLAIAQIQPSVVEEVTHARDSNVSQSPNGADSQAEQAVGRC